MNKKKMKQQNTEKIKYVTRLSFHTILYPALSFSILILISCPIPYSADHKPEDRAPSSWRGKYYQAAWVGKTAEDAASTCAKIYGRCPVPAKQLLEAMQAEKQ